MLREEDSTSFGSRDFGDDPASHVYVGSKVRACERLGIRSTHIELPANATEDEVRQTIESLNKQDGLHGILVQSPLPNHMDEEGLTDLIDPSKDVDGFHPQNLGRLVQGRMDGMLPCTPSGVMRMLSWAGIETEGKTAVVLGRSRIVGMPQSLLLSAKGVDSTVTVAHSRTKDTQALCSSADIIIAAVGRPEMVTVDWVKEGAVVVDVGINRVDDDTRERGWRLAGGRQHGCAAAVAVGRRRKAFGVAAAAQCCCDVYARGSAQRV